jgi:hypothetical protein
MMTICDIGANVKAGKLDGSYFDVFKQLHGSDEELIRREGLIHACAEL